MGVEQGHREQHKMWTIVSYKCSVVCMLDTLLSTTKNGRTDTDQDCYRHQLPVFQHFQWPLLRRFQDLSMAFMLYYYSNTHTHTRLMALFPGLPRWAGTRKVKPIWILLKQETASGSGISWAICKSAPRYRQITMQHPTTQFFTGRMPFLPPNQQRQSTEGTNHGKPTQHYS